MQELFEAARNNDALAVIDLIVKQEANPLMKNANGETPAHVAARLGHVDVIEAMPLPALSSINEYRQRPLHVAAENGQAAVCRALLARGLVFDCADDFGRTPLQLAHASGDRETIEAFGAPAAPAADWRAVMAPGGEGKSAAAVSPGRGRGGPEL